jgi:cobalt/nickel transport protein
VRRSLLVGVLVAAGTLLLIGFGPNGFAGTDTQAVAEIEERAPGYDQWTSPVWSPPGALGEPLLFALQAGLGAAVIWHYLGRLRTPSDASNA